MSMNNLNTDVSIIFVNYKTKDLTINAINSVIEKTQGINYEIFVVDNASNDGSIESIEKQFLNINIIKSEINGGFGYANNLAIKQAGGKYILCLNTDTILISNAIKIMFDFMEKEEYKDVAVCGGNLYDENNNPTLSFADFPNLINCTSFSYLFRNLFPNIKKIEAKKIIDVDVIIGADIFLRKEVLDKIGLFDEKFFMYAEEVDLCKRIKNAGYRIKIVPNAKIKHLEGKSSSNFWENSKMRVKSKYIYAKKHQSYLDIIVMKLSYIFIHIIAFIFTFKKQNIELVKEHFRG